ncbi:MAG: hypothetical protein U9N07_04185 [Euryarchaeota archaeon]|nr:hypothetical protein [Euryarchaeota archaeon]
MAVQVAASEELGWGKMPWEKKGMDIGEYYIEATDVSLGGSESEIGFGGSRIWVLITIYKNDSVVWRGVFANNTSQTFPNFPDYMDFIYSANKSGYTEFALDVLPPSSPFDHQVYHPDHPVYERLIKTCDNNGLEPVRIIDGTNLIEICANDLVIGSNPPSQYIVNIDVDVIDMGLSRMSFEEWINNTFVMIKSGTVCTYVRDKAFTEIKIANISMLDRVEIVDSIPDEFVIDPDRDLCWNYSLDAYRYSTKPLVPGNYTLPAANATVWYRGHRINLTSNTPDIDVGGPYVTITKTAELTGDVVNVTVSVCNTGEHVTMLYVFDSIPEGAELIEGVLNYTNLNYTAPNYIEAPRGVMEPAEGRYVNKYSIKINNSVVLPHAVAYYQTSKKVDVTREYRPEATFEIEKYINPKFYAGRSRSEEIEIRHENDTEPAADEGVEAADSMEPVEPLDAPDKMPDETTDEMTKETEQNPPQEKKGIVQKIPGFGSLFTMIGILTGYLILRNHDII